MRSKLDDDEKAKRNRGHKELFFVNRVEIDKITVNKNIRNMKNNLFKKH